MWKGTSGNYWNIPWSWDPKSISVQNLCMNVTCARLLDWVRGACVGLTNQRACSGASEWGVYISHNVIGPRNVSIVTRPSSPRGWAAGYKTISHTHRYNSLSEAHCQAFGAEEDYLLSLILHSLLVYMLSFGKSPIETTDIIHCLTARTRLATLEEKQLQKTLKIVEQNVRPSLNWSSNSELVNHRFIPRLTCFEIDMHFITQSSLEMDLSDVGLMSLYSDRSPSNYLIHCPLWNKYDSSCV